jgi:hypothetical protein
MKHIIGYLSAAVFVLCCCYPAAAQTGSVKSSAALQAEVNSLWPDNTGGLITPFAARQTLLDMIVSAGNGVVQGPATSVVGDIVSWNNTIGTLLQDQGVAIGVVTTLPSTNGAWNIGGTTALGAVVIGKGSTDDFQLQNSGGAPVMSNPTGTQNANFSGLMTASAITTDATHTDATVCEDTTTHAFYFGSGAAGICLGTSSMRFKHDISPLDVGLTQIMALQPIKYRLNADHGDPNKTLYGFSAEQGTEALPELVGLDVNKQPNTFDYVGVVPVLVRAIQEQQKEINELKEKLR